MSNGDRWRVRRKLFHEALNATTTKNFDSHQYKYAHRFLSRLLEAPERFMEEAELSVVPTLRDQTARLCITLCPKYARSCYTVRNLWDTPKIST